jgi:hypothetical protein
MLQVVVERVGQDLRERDEVRRAPSLPFDREREKPGVVQDFR